MVIPPNIGRWTSWVAFSVIAMSSHAQVFTYRHGAEHFQAVVEDNRLSVKERYLGLSSVYGDLSCPLGSAVKASRIADSKLCLTFSKEMCRYTRYQNGTPLHNDELANARMPRMCIALANDQDARRLARLVNAATHHAQQQPPAATGATTTDRVHATVAGPDSSQPPRESPPVAIVASEPAVPPAEKVDAREADSRIALPAKPSGAKATAPLAQKETRVADPKPPPDKWAVGSFTVGFSGNARLRERTYASATIVNKAGAARRPGGYLRLRNTSDKYPLYYGLHKQARYKLDAGESVTIPLASDESLRRAYIAQQVVTIRWLLDSEASRSAAAGRADARGRKEKASAKGTAPSRQPSTVTGRTLTVHPGETPGHRKWVAANVE